MPICLYAFQLALAMGQHLGHSVQVLQGPNRLQCAENLPDRVVDQTAAMLRASSGYLEGCCVRATMCADVASITSSLGLSFSLTALIKTALFACCWELADHQSDGGLL